MYEKDIIDTEMINSRFASRILIGTSIVFWLLVFWVFNASRFLRPASDDYCVGIRANLGPIGGFVQEFQTHSGFVTPSFLTNLFVGIPLANGPLWFGSSITFLFAALGMSFLTIVALMAASGLTASKKLVLFGLASLLPASIVAWWTFLWFPLDASTESPMDELAIGLTHWQNLNSAYVLPTALILSAALLLLRPSLSRNWRVTVASAVLGLVTGLMGPTFAMAAVLFMTLLASWILLRVEEMKARKLMDIGVASLTVMLGLLIAYLSPGTQSRASQYGAGEFVFAPGSIVGWIMAILPENLFMFGELLLHWGTAVVFSIFFGLGFFARKNIPTLETSNVLPIAIGLSVFGISLTSATIVTDTFAYGAYWHSSSIAVVAFAVCASFGFWAGGAFLNQLGSPGDLFACVVLLVGLVSGVGSSLDLSTSVVEREKLWTDSHTSATGIIDGYEPLMWPSCNVEELAVVNPAFAG